MSVVIRQLSFATSDMNAIKGSNDQGVRVLENRPSIEYAMKKKHYKGIVMPRKPRIVLSGYPVHIIQRGNNRTATFFADDDYRYYLHALNEACRRYHCAIHAYVLMTNHVHLLVTPTTATGPSCLMQSVGRRYVRYINQTYQRSGTLWEGRFKHSLIQDDEYYLTCSRYIELNPVRAGMVAHPGAYPWSSYRHNALGQPDPLIQPHALYLALGQSKDERTRHYRALFQVHIEQKPWKPYAMLPIKIRY